jgi:regulator of sirC expression with transglutaminase-like and TPR domain
MALQEINTLINLLNDPDTVVFDAVAAHFIEEGRNTIPALERVLAENTDEEVRARIQTIIRQIRTKEVQEGLQGWIDGRHHNLLEGAYWVAKLRYPSLTWPPLQNALDDMMTDILICTSDDQLQLPNKLTIFNQLFFQTHGYKRTNDTLNPIYCFINRVLETQCGNAISLGLLYLYLTQQNGWPLYGVCLPDIFLVACVNAADEVLCYINPFNNGTWAGKSSVTSYFEQRGIAPRPVYYRPCDNVTVLLRLIEYIIYTYEQEGNHSQADLFRLLLPLFGERTSYFLEGL